MGTEGQDFLLTMERLTEHLMEKLSSAPPESLDWRPGPDTNSIWAIGTHALSACRHWLVAVVAREPNPRDRESEFRSAASQLSELQSLCDHWLIDARRLLPSMTTADFDAPCDLSRTTGITFRTSASMTCRAAMLHAVDHLGIHIGHVELTAQLWQLQGEEV
jgi:uncharacterized damage-inducible protein DinB